MPTDQANRIIRHLRKIASVRSRETLSDGQLLELFVAQREEAALATLVERHGPMVLAVCRRVLRNPHDAEDAFQATFLVLLRKAASIARRDLLSSWLYGVAYRTALKARTASAKRRAKETPLHDLPTKPSAGQDWQELLPLLDQELNRLPDKYRAPVVLCDLEVKTRREAARLLGIPEGTLSTRLARGRALLAKKLARHGLYLSVGPLAVLLSKNAASATMPPALAASTVRAAGLWVAGKTTAEAISANVIALTEGVLKSMMLTRLKTSLVVLLALVLVGGGVRFQLYRLRAEGEPGTPAKVEDPRSVGGDRDVTEDDGSLAWDRLGLKLQLVGPAEVAQASRTLHGGMKVLAVRPNGPAAEQQVRKGDVVVGLNHWETRTRESVPFVLGFCQGKGMTTVRYTLVRGRALLRGELALEAAGCKDADPKLKKLGSPETEPGDAPSRLEKLADPKPSGKRTTLADPDVIVIDHRKLSIPVQVARAGPSLKELRLLVSTDEGKTWTEECTIAATEKAFTFCAPRDGLYWFLVQTVWADGRTEPSIIQAWVKPALKVRIETDGREEQTTEPGIKVR
jgi:RNA polymerase sigma factor (sigma-70 family)